MIFVFGSNLSGRHGAGAAKYAAEEYGAEEGVGVGPTGRAYAIPTKGRYVRVGGRYTLPTLSLEEIEPHAHQFAGYAAAHPELTFKLTAIGCGLAGFTPEQIAPLFAGCPANVLLPPEWRKVLATTPAERFWTY